MMNAFSLSSQSNVFCFNPVSRRSVMQLLPRVNRTLLTTLAAGLILGLTATVPASIMVDTGVDGQAVQTDFTEWSIAVDNADNPTPWSSNALIIESDFASGEFGSDVRFFLNDSRGGAGNLDARDRTSANSDVVGDPQEDLVNDFISADNVNADLLLTIQGFEAGTFSITTFHNDVQFRQGQTWDIELTDANGTNQPVGSVTNDAGQINSLTFNFTSSGLDDDDVVVTINGTGASGGSPRLNGFTIPEPASAALLGLGGMMLLGRRRR